jgi:hypothetical protein
MRLSCGSFFVFLSVSPGRKDFFMSPKNTARIFVAVVSSSEVMKKVWQTYIAKYP